MIDTINLETLKTNKDGKLSKKKIIKSNQKENIMIKDD